MTAVSGYENGDMAPGVKQHGTGAYVASYNQLKVEVLSYVISENFFRRYGLLD